MNIKNKPIIKMDAKEQIKFNLKREVQLLRLQNTFLRQEFMKLSGTSHIDMPDVAELHRLIGGAPLEEDGMFPSIHNKKNKMDVSQGFATGALDRSGAKASAARDSGPNAYSMMQRDYNRELNGQDALGQMEGNLAHLRQENAQMRYQKEIMNREFEGMMFENNQLSAKLANLEKVFIGESVTSEIGRDNELLDNGEDSTKSSKRYTHSLLVTENNELRARIESAEQDKIELKGVLIKLEADNTPSTGVTRDNSRDLSPRTIKKIMVLNESNAELEKQVQLLQGREKQIIDKLLDSYPKPSSSSSKKSSSSYMKFKQSMTNK